MSSGSFSVKNNKTELNRTELIFEQNYQLFLLRPRLTLFFFLSASYIVLIK